MNDSLSYHDDEHAEARCPIPDWALRPLAVAVPLMMIGVILWLVLR